MAHRGPVVTTIVVLGGLFGLMTANSAGEPVTEQGTAQPVGQPVGQPAARTSTPAPPPSPAATSKPVPPPPQFPKQVVYAGHLADSRIAVAVAVKGDQSAAYLCDGRSLEVWLRGTAKDGAVDLKSKSGKTHLVARLTGRKLTGTVTLSTKDHEFGIDVAPPPAGLYRARGGNTTIGWIVLPSGRQVGIVTTADASEAAPALDPSRGRVTVDGQTLTAAPVTGDTVFE